MRIREQRKPATDVAPEEVFPRERLRGSSVPRPPTPSSEVQRHLQCACGGNCEHCRQQSSDMAGSRTKKPDNQLAVGSAKQAMNLSVKRYEGPQIHDTTDGIAQGALLKTGVPPPGAPGSRLREGLSLPPSTKKLFESRLRTDFSGVKVHADSQASESARELGAAAYTAGEHIVLGAGRYAPETEKGQRLLAHELTHVVQQRLAESPSQWIGEQDSAEEQQAKQAMNLRSWGSLQTHYNDLTGEKVQHSGMRPPPVMPRLTPARAHIQRVQLTYDDGPDSAGNTRAVLNELNKAGARATFYLVGKRVAQGDNWRIVFDIAAAGHWLGNHAYDWNDATDNHIFLSGTAEERTQKILQTEWAIRDALVQGRKDAQTNNSWVTIAQANREYIEDVIAHGTGRFRTPGFRSHMFHQGTTVTTDGATTMAAIESSNHVLAAIGLRPLAITKSGGGEGVDVDPEDWRSGRTQKEIESGVKGKLSSNTDSILLHSRIAATAGATPAIAADIQSRKFTFDATPQGGLGSIQPKSGFLKMSFSDPPTSAEIVAARASLKANMAGWGPFISGSVAIGIFQLAQRAGPTDVTNFIAEIKSTKIPLPTGDLPMANWLNANEEWRQFAWFLEAWVTNKPFPRIKGVTL